jgi:uncharacterized protein (TIGR01777 family)
MKVVIAGGSGLIGRALSTALATAGHDVIVLTRDPQRARVPAGVRAVAWDPPAVGPWIDDVGAADAVVNLSGASVGRWPWTAGRRRTLRESRLLPTATLVSAIGALPENRRPHALLNASGTDVYEGRDATAADESVPPADTFLARLCVDWEAEARRAEAFGVRVVLMRMSLVVASSATSLRLLMLPFRLFVGGPVGSGLQWMSWIGIDDVVGLAFLALESEALRGPVNFAAPDSRPQAEFARAVGKAIHRPSWLRTPAWAVRLVLGQQATLALGSRRIWPAKALAAGYAFRTPRLEEALERAVSAP